MMRKNALPLALALAAGAAPAAQAQRRQADQQRDPSVGHFHFQQDLDVGPPGSSVGVAAPIGPVSGDPPELERASQHYAGWRTDPTPPPEGKRAGPRVAAQKSGARKPSVAVAASALPAPTGDALRRLVLTLREHLGWGEVAKPPSPVGEDAAPEEPDVVDERGRSK